MKENWIELTKHDRFPIVIDKNDILWFEKSKLYIDYEPSINTVVVLKNGTHINAIEEDYNKLKENLHINDYHDISEDDTERLFKGLVKSLDMECVLEDNDSYKLKYDNKSNEINLYLGNEIYDDRGELYRYLCKVAGLIFPNIEKKNLDILPVVGLSEEET